MSIENEALMRRWFDEVWNEKRAESIDALMAADCRAHGMGPNGTTVQGTDAFKAVHATFCGAFPDIHMTVDPVFASGDMAACHFTCTATHLGDHLGIAATGKPVIIRAMTIARYEDGLIVEGWNCVDLLSVFQQVGAMPIATALP